MDTQRFTAYSAPMPFSCSPQSKWHTSTIHGIGQELGGERNIVPLYSSNDEKCALPYGVDFDLAYVSLGDIYIEELLQRELQPLKLLVREIKLYI